MNLLKRPYTLRRYLQPQNELGYIYTTYEDKTLYMDVQTAQNNITQTQDGREAKQTLKVFCDSEILTENEETQQRADSIWFQGKWFDCTACRLSDNTPLRHYTATFVEAGKQEEPPEDM